MRIAASMALRPLLLGPPRRLERSLALRHAAAFGPLMVVGGDAVLPPHGCLTADPGVVARVATCDSVEAGAGRIVADGLRGPNALSGAGSNAEGLRGPNALSGAGSNPAGNLVLEVGRWWDPRPRTAPTTVPALATRAALLGADPVPDLVSAPQEAAPRMLGSGRGLTPSGDDVLTGFVAAVRVLSDALAATPPPWLDPFARWLRDEAPHRTTDLSARLLAHATRGQVMAPVAAVLCGLCSGDTLAGDVARLREVGATSGDELVLGIVSGVAAVAQHAERAAA